MKFTFMAVAVGWTGTVFSFSIAHFSVIVGILSGVAAIVASGFAIIASRKTARLKDLQIEEELVRLKKLRAPEDPQI